MNDDERSRRQSRIGVVLAAALALGVGACGDLWKAFSAPVDVRFTVDKDTLHVGEELRVEFQTLKGGDGRRYWLGLVPDDTPLEDYSGCAEIAPETDHATLTAATPGPHAVRVYSDRRGPVSIAGSGKVTVLP